MRKIMCLSALTLAGVMTIGMQGALAGDNSIDKVIMTATLINHSDSNFSVTEGEATCSPPLNSSGSYNNGVAVIKVSDYQYGANCTWDNIGHIAAGNVNTQGQETNSSYAPGGIKYNGPNQQDMGLCLKLEGGKWLAGGDTKMGDTSYKRLDTDYSAGFQAIAEQGPHGTQITLTMYNYVKKTGKCCIRGTGGVNQHACSQ